MCLKAGHDHFPCNAFCMDLAFRNPSRIMCGVAEKAMAKNLGLPGGYKTGLHTRKVARAILLQRKEQRAAVVGFGGGVTLLIIF